MAKRPLLESFVVRGYFRKMASSTILKVQISDYSVLVIGQSCCVCSMIKVDANHDGLNARLGGSCRYSFRKMVVDRS